MKARIEVKGRAEQQAIELALSDPTTRAFVLTVGYLMPLPSDRARARVLAHVADLCSENDETRRKQATEVISE